MSKSHFVFFLQHFASSYFNKPLEAAKNQHSFPTIFLSFSFYLNFTSLGRRRKLFKCFTKDCPFISDQNFESYKTLSALEISTYELFTKSFDLFLFRAKNFTLNYLSSFFQTSGTNVISKPYLYP